MTTTPQDSFLRQASAAARAAGHIFPDYAACEAALESTWGQSRLAREANNLFGQKQSAEGNPKAPAPSPCPRRNSSTAAGSPSSRDGPASPISQPASAPAWRCSAASSRAIPPTPAPSPPPPAKPSSKRSRAPGPPIRSAPPRSSPSIASTAPASCRSAPPLVAGLPAAALAHV